MMPIEEIYRLRREILEKIRIANNRNQDTSLLDAKLEILDKILNK